MKLRIAEYVLYQCGSPSRPGRDREALLDFEFRIADFEFVWIRPIAKVFGF